MILVLEPVEEDELAVENLLPLGRDLSGVELLKGGRFPVSPELGRRDDGRRVFAR
jgi:hypothetical protein